MNVLKTSVLSLTKNLTGKKWIEAYEILLDFQSHQNEEDLTNGSALLLDLSVQLQIEGKTNVANQLRRLVQDSHNDESMLLLLALCATKDVSCADAKSALFPLLPVILPTNRVSPRTPFLLSCDPGFSSFDVLECTISASLTDCRDFISNAAKEILKKGTLSAPEAVRGPAQSNVSPSGLKSSFDKSQLHPGGQKDAHNDPAVGENWRLSRESKDILHLLISGSEYVKNGHATFTAEAAPNCGGMEKRRTEHIGSCFSCSQRRIEFIIGTNLLQSSSLTQSGATRDSNGMRNRAISCGYLYQGLVCFSAAYWHYSNRVLSSIASYCHDMAQAYLLRVLEVLNSDMESSVTSTALLFAAEHSKDDMIAAMEVLSAVERSSGIACAILDILHEALPKYQGVNVVQELFFAALGPYMEMVWDWFFHASSSHDVGIEFFGTKLGKSVTDSESLSRLSDKTERLENLGNESFVPDLFRLESALFILRAGRSRGLLETLSPNDPLLRVNLPLSPDPLSVVELNAIVLEMSRLATRLEDENRSHFENSHARNLSGERLIMVTDPAEDRCKAVEKIKNQPAECKSHWEKERFFVVPCEEYEISGIKHHSRLFSVDDTGRKSDALSENMRSKMFTTSSPRTFCERMIIGDLRRIDVFIQRRILNHFVAELKVFEHLRLLRDLALLGAGDFGDVLVEQICGADATSSKHEKFITRRVSTARTFYGTSGAGGVAFRKRRHLAACLRTALGVTSTVYSALSDNFSISVGSSEMSRAPLWESHMKVEYQIDFPLNLIISSDALSLYSKFFDFFLSVRRAQRSLRSLFMITRRQSVLRHAKTPWSNSLLSKRNLRVNLWQFCWHAEHFVSIVGGYEFNQIHGLSWTEFETSWKGITSIWELRDGHMNYLHDAVRRVLLGERQKSVMNVITGALKMIFDVEANIANVVESDFSCTAVGNEISELLSTSTEGLKRRSTFLIDVLEKLVANGSHSHLHDFLTRLNFNSYYKSDKL